MADLDTILNSDTLLRAAYHRRPTGLALPDSLPLPNPNSETANERKAIWHYKIDPGTHQRVSSLTCLVRSMNFMKMTVCDSLEWSDVIISIGGRDIRLPLTSDYLVVSEYLDRGTVQAATYGLWQLPMNIDQSFQKVFCYDVGPVDKLRHPGSGSTPEPQPVSPAVYDGPSFMPHPYNPSIVEAACGTICTIYTPNLYVVVVMSLVCCKENNDFEPGGVLQAGRFYPLFQVVANHPIDRIDAQITHRRPQRLPAGHEHMDGENMLPDVTSALFSDTNDRSLPAPVVWTHTFGYYDDSPALGRYVMVDPALSERTITGAVAHAEVKTSEGPFSVKEWIEEKAVGIRKVARQAEFDNIHVAPKMVAPESIRTSRKFWKSTLDNIVMAPFCVHDCMHTHTRWSADDKAKHALGWDGYKPYSKAGAPMVPPNQKITIELLAPYMFRYIATVFPNLYVHDAYGISAGQWQTINHHGSAYALAVNNLGEAARRALYAYLAVNNEPIVGEVMEHHMESWAMFYWHLRYTMGRHNTYAERVRVLDLAKARG